ncbi:hypothetical protein CHLNCDRAFT_138482 [Chlorella variabilis]|uniref:Amino acid transporter transmembrane domain-containing protein n=1 Tax=Chlorella variabilis TaxID=554065 RepID=E1ZN55_CHLVA|nr:hypothetical protein CHLNCDRAFT_138482 [Chlorella variabilis]EFN52813.1 hypothetical protein CHLNCDRAFT_138482 [Chlorella variabilis]|eukprot:XP_005844915.1 hypothetical protein CHLNCDRAFT_138482 [Chlorella variabilis]
MNAAVHGTGITPLVASPLPPAASMGRETSQTDPQLLEELLPFLDTSSEGHMGTTGQQRCALSLAKSILGAGLVAVPHAFLLLGAVPATAAFLAVAALMLYSCRCLAAASHATAQLSYSGVLAAQLGRRAAAVLDVFMVLNCFGMMVVYVIAAGDAVVPDAEWLGNGVPAWLRALLSSRPTLLGLLTLLILAPLLSFRQLKQTTLVSALGVAAVALWASITLYLAAILALTWELLHESWQHAMLQLAAVLPVLIMAFMCQMSFFSVLRELEAPASPRRMTNTAGGALVLSLAVTLVLAASSEAVFGGSIGHNVLSSFSVANIRCVAEEFGDWQFYALTYGILAAVYLVAVSLPSVWKPLQLLGATAGAVIACVLPGCLALSLVHWRLWSGAGAGGVLLIALGLVLAVAGIAKLQNCRGGESAIGNA